MKAPNSATVQAETAKLLDYAFDNFTLTPLAASEGTFKNAFPVLFEDEEALISEVSSPLSVSDASLVLPIGATYGDLTQKVRLTPSKTFTAGENIIGDVEFYFADNYVGSASIIYHTEEDIIVVPSPTPTVTPTPVPVETITPEQDTVDNSTETSNNVSSDPSETDKRPLIIGLIVGGVVLIAGFYVVLIELPYRKKKKAYQKKYGRMN